MMHEKNILQNLACSQHQIYTQCIHVSFHKLELQWNSVTARADGPGTFSHYCRVLVIPKWWIYQGKQRDLRGLQCDGGCVTLGLRAGRERQQHRARSSQTKMRGGRGGRGRGDYTPHKDAPFVVFLCYRPPRDVPYRELDDEVGVGWVARTFVTRKDRKSLIITEMIIH